MRDDEYSAIKDRAARTLLKIPGVNAVGIGGRETAGEPTGERAIVVFVTRKKPVSEVPLKELIPTSFEGVPIDVVQGGPYRQSAGPTQDIPNPLGLPDIKTYDPLLGGISLATEGTPGVGTLGCFLVDKNDATAVYALTNYHVVAKNGKLSRSRRVLHPGEPDSSVPPPDEKVAEDTIGIVAAGGLEAIRDAALIRLRPGKQWLPSIQDVGFVAGQHAISQAEAQTKQFRVWKRGIKTGLIGGFVDAVDAPAPDVQSADGKTSINTKGNILVRKRPDGPDFGGPGDSGAVVVTDDSEIVGLYYANDLNGGGIVTPIATVLERFQTVDHLDLDVATPKTATPTEETEKQTVPPPGGKAHMTGTDQTARGDRNYYRPLTGGAPILVAPMLRAPDLAAANAATVGCVLAADGDPAPAWLLTAYTALSSENTLTPTADTVIGQPDNTGHCSQCTTNTVGHFFAGPADEKRVGFVALSKDQKWLPEIMQVGLLNGSRDLTKETPLPTDLPVVKQGGGSGLTGGVITKIELVDGNPTIFIRPNPNAAQPGQPLFFSQHADRGAVVVDDSNRVVGVLYGEQEVTDAFGTHFHGLAAPIQDVLEGLNVSAGVAVSVPTETGLDNARTTQARVLDEVSPATLPAPPLPAGAPVEPLALPVPWRDHQVEVQHLIARNRKVAAIWRRHGGPSLVQALVRAFHAPAEAIPLFVGGVSTVACLERLSGVLCKYGSAELRASLARLREVLPVVGGFRFDEVLASVREALAKPEEAR